MRNKIFSMINISGLAIGLGCFLLIALYVLDEISYDRYNEKGENIYRINADIRFGGGDLHMPFTSDMKIPEFSEPPSLLVLKPTMTLLSMRTPALVPNPPLGTTVIPETGPELAWPSFPVPSAFEPMRLPDMSGFEL